MSARVSLIISLKSNEKLLKQKLCKIFSAVTADLLTWSKLWTVEITLNLSKYDYFWFKYYVYVWKNTFCIEIFFTTFCCILLHLQSWKKILVSLMANSISLEVWYRKFHWNLFKSVTTFNIKVAKSQKAFTFSSNL